MAQSIDSDFPCSLTIDLPLPTSRLATAALRSLSVDAELSPLVCRTFTTIPPSALSQSQKGSSKESEEHEQGQEAEKSILRTEYKATTNRMLRVAVNGFMESLGVVLGVMEELDVDVLGVDLEREG